MIWNRKVNDANIDAGVDNNDALEAVPTDVYWLMIPMAPTNINISPNCQ